MRLKKIEGECNNNKSKALIKINDLINERKKVMGELDDSADYNNLKFEYVGSEYMDSKKLFVKKKVVRLNFVK